MADEARLQKIYLAGVEVVVTEKGQPTNDLIKVIQEIEAKLRDHEERLDAGAL